MNEPVAYINGEYLPVSQAKLSIFDQGIVQGASVTEMVRTFRQRLFRLDAHLDRLQQSIRAVGFQPDVSRDELQAIAEKLVIDNAAVVPEGHELGLAMFVTAGDNPTYIGGVTADRLRQSSVCIHTFPLPYELWADQYETGQHLVTPSLRHIPPESLDARIKTRSRLNWYLADQEARLADPRAKALVLDRDANVTECSTANFLIVSGGRILVPDPASVLGGVSQHTVAELTEELGIEFAFAQIKVYDVLTAEEAMTSSTPYCLLPVTRLNGKPIGDGHPGPVFGRLIAAWSNLVGVNIVAQMQEGARRRRTAASRTQ